jgi:hypothetical protein
MATTRYGVRPNLYDPETFEISIEDRHFDFAAHIRCRSQRYEVHYAVSVREGWGDSAPLANFIERLIGGTLAAWERAGVSPGSGREMARALMPHWEREIHAFMEHLERQQRQRTMVTSPPVVAPESHFVDALRYAHQYGAMEFWRPQPENPAAKKKARELLVSNLNEAQKKTFTEKGEFAVAAKDGKTYTVKTARSFNVIGPDGMKYCGQLNDAPVEDQMLAQKLLLEHEPDKFFKNANKQMDFAMSGDTERAAMMRMMQEQVRHIGLRPEAYLVNPFHR